MSTRSIAYDFPAVGVVEDEAELERYRLCPQCSGVQAGGEAGFPAERGQGKADPPSGRVGV